MRLPPTRYKEAARDAYERGACTPTIRIGINGSGAWRRLRPRAPKQARLHLTPSTAPSSTPPLTRGGFSRHLQLEPTSARAHAHTHTFTHTHLSSSVELASLDLAPNPPPPPPSAPAWLPRNLPPHSGAHLRHPPPRPLPFRRPLCHRPPPRLPPARRPRCPMTLRRAAPGELQRLAIGTPTRRLRHAPTALLTLPLPVHPSRPSRRCGRRPPHIRRRHLLHRRHVAERVIIRTLSLTGAPRRRGGGSRPRAARCCRSRLRPWRHDVR